MQLHEHLNQSINIRCTDGWIDGWMDIWRDQWMKHWIDRFKHRWCIHAHSTARVCFADFLRSWPPSTDFPAEEDCPEPAWLWQFQYAGQMHALKSLAEFRQKDARIFSQVWESLRCHIFLCYIRYIYIYISSLLIFQVGWNLGWSSFEKSSLCGLDELWPVWLTVQAARCWAAAVWDIWGGRKWSFMKLCLFAYGYGFMGFLLDD